MRKTTRNVVLAISLSLVFISPPVWAAEPGTSDAALTKAIRDADVVDSDSPLSAKIEGMESTVTTDRHPKATDDDCKIDATLIAKAVFEKHKNLAKVRINFVGANSTTSVSVSAGDICAFNNGGISDKQLLNGIDLTTVSNKAALSSDTPDVQNPPDVAQTPDTPKDTFKRVRNLRNRIQTMRQNGTGVTEFQKRLDQITQMIDERKETDAAPLIDKLDDILREQQTLVKQAKFKPVPVASSWQAGGAGRGGRYDELQPQFKTLPPVAQRIRDFLSFSDNAGIDVSAQRAKYNELVKNADRDPAGTEAKLNELVKSIQQAFPNLSHKFEQMQGRTPGRNPGHDTSKFGPGGKPPWARKQQQY